MHLLLVLLTSIFLPLFPGPEVSTVEAHQLMDLPSTCTYTLEATWVDEQVQVCDQTELIKLAGYPLSNGYLHDVLGPVLVDAETGQAFATLIVGYPVCADGTWPSFGVATDECGLEFFPVTISWCGESDWGCDPLPWEPSDEDTN